MGPSLGVEVEYELVDRDTRQLRLSSVGRDFFFKARRVLDDLDAAVLGIRELGDRATGEITIGAVPTATCWPAAKASLVAARVVGQAPLAIT